MTKGDQLIERGAQRLEALSRNAANKGGVSAKLADQLAEDAAFLRKLKPSLIAARARGRAPKNEEPARPRAAPSAPQIKEKRPPKQRARSKRKRGAPNPFVVAGVAVAAGVLLAKAIDWRSHAHPRD
jgi:hypothetical protein